MKVFSLIFCLFLATASVIGNDGATENVSRRDVFLFTIDTLRSDHVRCYGYERIQTPAIDQLASQGIRFAQAFTPSPITNTSHTTILTGLLPSSHGVSDFGVPLAATHFTLAELLGKQGYRTAAFIGSVILDSKTLAPGLDRGFEFYDNFPEKIDTKSRWGRIERRGMDVVQRAETWLSAHRTAPRFAWVHLYDPHDPYEPPPPYSETYKDRLYDGEIAYADSALSHFLAYLKEQSWYDGALIIVVGDHGEGLGEHGEDTHGIFLYDSTTHVPLILKLPNQQEAGKVVEGQVRTTDIAPTILDLLGVPAPANLDGTSLQPFVGSDAAPRIVFGETDYPLRFGWAPLRSVRMGGSKLIEAPRPEFYDLRSDAGELHNRYAPWDATVQKLRKSLAELSAKSSPAAGKPSPATVSPGTVDELRALGYLGAADARSSTDVREPSLLPDPKDKIKEQNLLHIAMMASEDEQTAKARVALEKLLQLNPNQLAARLLLGQLHLRANEPKAAEDQFEAAVLLQPGNTEAQLGLARALLREKKFTDAAELLQESVKSSANNADLFDLLAQAYKALGKPTDAQRAEDQARKIRATKEPH